MTTTLFQQLSHPDALREAWGRVRDGGKAPGLDGVRLEQFQFHQEREITRLSQDLRLGEYRPWPARAVDIPKAAGGTRRVGIQAVRDRVVQRSLLARLQPRIEPMLEDASFAFRPGRSVAGALTAMAGWRDQGYGWAAHSDVRLCFDRLNRGLLERALVPVLPEADVRGLVGAWLSAGIVDAAGWQDTGEGVRQGDVLSPLLCNLYLDPFDEALNAAGTPLVRYADDFVLLARTSEEAVRGLERARMALAALELELNSTKTEVRAFRAGFEFLGAGIAGSLILPLHRVERPGRRPVFTFGYERTAPRKRPPAAPALAGTKGELHRRMVALLRLERSGRPLPAIATALLGAWMQAGRLRCEQPENDWESVYLI